MHTEYTYLQFDDNGHPFVMLERGQVYLADLLKSLDIELLGVEGQSLVNISGNEMRGATVNISGTMSRGSIRR